MSEGAQTGPVLLYDGSCGLCAASVQFVLRHDARGTLKFAPLDGAFARGVRAAHPELAGVDSVVWVEPGGARVLTRSAAALRVGRYLGGFWALASLAWLVPRPWRDAVYGWVARHRHQLRPGGAQCLVPSPGERHRFLS